MPQKQASAASTKSKHAQAGEKPDPHAELRRQIGQLVKTPGIGLFSKATGVAQETLLGIVEGSVDPATHELRRINEKLECFGGPHKTEH